MNDPDTSVTDTSVKQPKPGDPESAECAPLTIPQIRMYVQWSDEDENWCVDDSPSPNPKKKTRPIMVQPESGEHDIIFELRPPRNLDWTFAEPSICASDNVGCPPPDGLNSDQLYNPRLDARKQVLTVTDRNDNEARLIRYKLHFLNEQGQPLPVCDPVILNGGGGDD